MRKFILLTIATIFFIASATAQDIIVFRDTNEVAAKVTAIAQDNVSYKRWDNLDGPVYTVNKADVFYIKYQNGLKDIFENTTTTNQSNNIIKVKTIGSSSQKYSFNGVKLQSYIYAGGVFFKQAGGPTFDANIGARLYDYAYIGIEAGFHYIFLNQNIYDTNRYGDIIKIGTRIVHRGYIPIGINVKGYIPVGKKIYPYINCSFGSFIGLFDFNSVNGFYCQAGAGIDIKRFSIGLGYSGLIQLGSFTCGYVKLGVRLGKW